MLTLKSGASSVVVAPEYGAGLIGWMIGSTPMFRRALPQASVAGDPHAMGCFPLLPYCNRIGHSRFRWRGTEYQIERNFGDHPHSIHGIGWQRPWTVTEAGARSATLSLDHPPDPSWPFAFTASVRYALDATALIIAISLTSRHDGPTPAGIGVHPFFPRQHSPMLRFNAAGAWSNGSDALPSDHAPVPADWNHADPRAVLQSRLDNCFTGWDGTASFHAGPGSLRIHATEAFRQLQVFTPSWADFFCVEPVSHIPDAINRPNLPPEQAMHVLEPGGTLAGEITFTATA